MGTIRKTTTDSWRVWYDLGPDPVTGKRRQRTKTLPTRTAAEEFLVEREAERTAGLQPYDVASERVTVVELVNMYLKARKPHLRASSWESVRSRLHTHVVPVLGKQKVRRLTGLLLDEYYARLLESGVSRATVRKVHTNLHTMFEYAVKHDILKENPCRKADPPSHSSPEMRTWTAVEASNFVRAIREHKLEPAFLLLAVTGMRRGEVCGLKWFDVGDHITIRRNVTEVNGQLIVGEPKSARGRRRIAIDETVQRFLHAVELEQKKNRLRYGESWQGEGWVVCDELGRQIRPGRLSKTFRKLIDEAGLPPIRLHDLRHTWSTLAIASGVDAKTVSENVGHASVAFTLDTYAHRVEEAHQTAARRISDAYGVTPDVTRSESS